jgi:hypothetical protein
VIEKTGVLGYEYLEKLRRGTKIFPPKMVLRIGRSQIVPGKLKVTLHKMHLLDHLTRLFLIVENISEKFEAVQSDARLIQGKKQFGRVYGSDKANRNIKNKIPAGIEETGVLLFEPLSDSIEPVKVHLEFFVSDGRNSVFDFDGIKISG